ncbi:MAG: hypothetical protein AB7P03_13615 [Kofleriaceae bacterium]
MRKWFATSLFLLCGCSERDPALSTREQQFGAGTFDRIHEGITDDALGGFLRAGVLEDIRDEHADFADDTAADDKWVHSDGCAFDETIQQINAFYANAVANLVPDASVFEPWSATDDFGRALHPIQDFYSHSNWVELGFPQFDDPSTSAVEITGSDLVDFGTRLAGPDALGAWQTPARPTAGLATVRGDILMVDMVDTPLAQVNNTGALDIRDANGDGGGDANDATYRPFEPGWRFGLLPHPTIAGDAGFVPGVDTNGDATFTYLGTDEGIYEVPVMTSGADKRLLISGIGGRPVADIVGNQCDPYKRDAAGTVIEPFEINTCAPPLYPDDGDPLTPPVSMPDDYSCIAYHGSTFALTHSGSDRSELNKDRSGSAPTRYPKARALAYLQTQYEWCRLVSQAGDWDGDGLLLSLWVREGASANPYGTQCGADDGRGPMGVTVTIDSVQVLDDKDNDDDEPGELNLSLALYDNPHAFHRLTKSKVGAIDVREGDVINPGLAPLTQCVGRADHTFRVALHGWDDDDDGNGELEQHGSSPGDANVDDPIVGFTATIDATTIPIGGSIVRETLSRDLRVTYHVTRAADVDGDGVDACGEAFYGTSPTDGDSDDDGVSDGAEVNGANPTNPQVADSDGDGLPDGQEDGNHNGAWDAGETNPNDADSDDDAIADGVELNGANPTNPLDADTDDDGLTDGQEDANRSGGLDPGETNPNDADSDDDGLQDGLEVSVGTSPLDADSDDDGVPDGRDTGWLESAIVALPNSAFRNPSNRNPMLNHLENAEKQAKKGHLPQARNQLESLRQHIDGCGAASDSNDWIIDCVTQVRIRALVDIVLANL